MWILAKIAGSALSPARLANEILHCPDKLTLLSLGRCNPRNKLESAEQTVRIVTLPAVILCVLTNAWQTIT